MGKRRRRYEVEFAACLLACGPMPWISSDDFDPWANDGVGGMRQKYQDEVMQWWCGWHSSNVHSPPTRKSQFRFYKKFRTWQKVYLRRVYNE